MDVPLVNDTRSNTEDGSVSETNPRSSSDSRTVISLTDGTVTKQISIGKNEDETTIIRAISALFGSSTNPIYVHEEGDSNRLLPLIALRELHSNDKSYRVVFGEKKSWWSRYLWPF